jgi:hypothetical protein
MNSSNPNSDSEDEVSSSIIGMNENVKQPDLGEIIEEASQLDIDPEEQSVAADGVDLTDVTL